MGDSFLCWATLFAPLAVSFVARRRTHSSNRGEDDGKHFQGEDLYESHAPFFLDMMIVRKLVQKEHTKLVGWRLHMAFFILEFLRMHDDLQSFHIIFIFTLEADRWHLRSSLQRAENVEVKESLECHPVVVGGDHICIQSLEEPPRKWCSNVWWVFETLQ